MIKALLIDDDQKLGDLLKNYLKTFDIELSEVKDPRQGNTTNNHLQPDIIINKDKIPHKNQKQLTNTRTQKNSNYL